MDTEKITCIMSVDDRQRLRRLAEDRQQTFAELLADVLTREAGKADK